jgi:hypothetical protein
MFFAPIPVESDALEVNVDCRMVRMRIQEKLRVEPGSLS